MKRVFFIAIIIALLTSCNLFNEGDSNSSVYISLVESRTVRPVGQEVNVYLLSATGPGGKNLTNIDLGSTLNDRIELDVGQWDLELKGYDADGILILSGTLSVTLEKNSSPVVSIPLSIPSGSGNVVLDMSWNTAVNQEIVVYVENAQDSAQFYTYYINDLSTAESSRVYTIPLPTGIYSVEISLKSGDNIIGYYEDLFYVYDTLDSSDTFVIPENTIHSMDNGINYILNITEDNDGVIDGDTLILKFLNNKYDLIYFDTSNVQQNIDLQMNYTIEKSNVSGNIVKNITLSSGFYKDWVFKLTHTSLDSGSFEFHNSDSSIVVKGNSRVITSDETGIDVFLNNNSNLLLDFNNFYGNIPLYLSSMDGNYQKLIAIDEPGGSPPNFVLETEANGDPIQANLTGNRLSIDNLSNDLLDFELEFTSSKRGIFNYNITGSNRVGYFNFDTLSTNINQWNTYPLHELADGDLTLYIDNNLYTFTFNTNNSIKLEGLLGTSGLDYISYEYLGTNSLNYRIYRTFQYDFYGIYDFYYKINSTFASDNQSNSIIFTIDEAGEKVYFFNNNISSIDDVMNNTNFAIEATASPNVVTWWNTNYPSKYISFTGADTSTGIVFSPTEANKYKDYAGSTFGSYLGKIKKITPTRVAPMTLEIESGMMENYSFYFPDNSGRGVFEAVDGNNMLIGSGVFEIKNSYDTGFEVTPLVSGDYRENNTTYAFNSRSFKFEIANPSTWPGGAAYTEVTFNPSSPGEITANYNDLYTVSYNLYSISDTKIIINVNKYNCFNDYSWIVYDTTDQSNPKVYFGNDIISYLKNGVFPNGEVSANASSF